MHFPCKSLPQLVFSLLFFLQYFFSSYLNSNFDFCVIIFFTEIERHKGGYFLGQVKTLGPIYLKPWPNWFETCNKFFIGGLYVKSGGQEPFKIVYSYIIYGPYNMAYGEITFRIWKASVTTHSR